MNAPATISTADIDKSAKPSATDIELLLPDRRDQLATRMYVEAKALATNFDDSILRIPTGSRTHSLPLERLISFAGLGRRS